MTDCMHYLYIHPAMRSHTASQHNFTLYAAIPWRWCSGGGAVEAGEEVQWRRGRRCSGGGILIIIIILIILIIIILIIIIIILLILSP